MSDVIETGDEAAQNDADEMASLMAGYNARGATPPADVPSDTSAQPGGIPANDVLNDAPQDGDPADPPVIVDAPVKDAAQLLEEKLAALKEEVRAIATNGDPAVRKLHGEIGDINRKLKQLETKPEPQAAPVDDELTAAMLGAEKMAEDFQELGGPLVTALKAVAKAGQRAAPVSTGPTQEEINAQIEIRAQQLLAGEQQRQFEEAQKVLKVDHPDFDSVMRSKEFDAWVKTKPADLQDTIIHTENPLLAARFLGEFKDSQRTQQKKQERLRSAVTPQGVAVTSTAPSKLTPEEEIMLGYQGRAPRPMNKR